MTGKPQAITGGTSNLLVALDIKWLVSILGDCTSAAVQGHEPFRFANSRTEQ